MATVDFGQVTPNSHKYREQQNQIQVQQGQQNQILVQQQNRKAELLTPVITGKNLVQTKKPLTQRIVEMFVGDDTDSLGGYIATEIVVPAIKNMLLDIAEGALLGGGRGFQPRRYFGKRDKGYDYSYPYRSQYSYESRDSRRSTRREDYDDRYSNKGADYRAIVVLDGPDSRIQAQEIVDRLRELIEIYNQASIADLYRMVGVPSAYTDNNWGWTNPNDIGMRKVSTGWLIDVAEAEYLE